MFKSKTEDNVPVGKLQEKNMETFFCILKVTEERSRIWIYLVRGTDPGIPDQHQNVTDPQH
jgi:hypothetical protein